MDQSSIKKVKKMINPRIQRQQMMVTEADREFLFWVVEFSRQQNQRCYSGLMSKWFGNSEFVQIWAFGNFENCTDSGVWKFEEFGNWGIQRVALVQEFGNATLMMVMRQLDGVPAWFWTGEEWSYLRIVFQFMFCFHFVLYCQKGVLEYNASI